MATRSPDLTLTRNQIVDLMEQEAQQRYDRSAAQLIAQYRAGTFDPCGGAADLISLARLLPEGDPLRLDD